MHCIKFMCLRYFTSIKWFFSSEYNIWNGFLAQYNSTEWLWDDADCQFAYDCRVSLTSKGENLYTRVVAVGCCFYLFWDEVWCMHDVKDHVRAYIHFTVTNSTIAECTILHSTYMYIVHVCLHRLVAFTRAPKTFLKVTLVFQAWLFAFCSPQNAYLLSAALLNPLGNSILYVRNHHTYLPTYTLYPYMYTIAANV